VTAAGISEIVFYDITGKIIFERKNISAEDEIKITSSLLEDLLEGIYFLRVKNKDADKVFKLLKKK